MNTEIPAADSRRRLHRTIVLGAVCIGASALGLFFARPIAIAFQHAPLWILPALAVGALIGLAVTALLILPKLSSHRH